MVKQWILLILISVLSSPLWAYNRPGSDSQKTESLCGIVKSAYFKRDVGDRDPRAIVTVISQSRVLKILSVELTLGFLSEMYPDMSLEQAGTNNLSNFRLTWSSSSMNDFHQLCLEGLRVQQDSKGPGVEFVSDFNSYSLSIN